MRSMLVGPKASIRCSMCDAPLFTVRDTRFGLPPAAVICRACTLQGFQDHNDLAR